MDVLGSSDHCKISAVALSNKMIATTLLICEKHSALTFFQSLIGTAQRQVVSTTGEMTNSASVNWSATC